MKPYFLYVCLLLLIKVAYNKKARKLFPTENNIIVMDDNNFEKVVETY